MSTVFFAGGGTGGHLMPALAIADAMVRLDPSVRPFFVGSLRGIEANVLPQRPWPYELLPLEPFRRRQWWKNVGLPASLFQVLRRTSALLREQRPRLIIGTGGYVAGPVVWAAVRAGVPAVLQEQNAFPGLATRRLASRVRQIHLGFPEARQHLNPGEGTLVLDTGNPVLPPPEPRPDPAAARKRLGLAPDRLTVLVVGGSQGALAVNEVVERALERRLWSTESQLLWQTGAGTYDRFRHWDDGSGVLVRPFLDPVSDAYAAADVMVSRAGAMTLAELCAWGLPAIVIPLPTAAAGHQLSNARALAHAGAAVRLDQHAATPEALSQAVSGLLAHPEERARLRAAATSRARPAAADSIAAKALEILKSA